MLIEHRAYTLRPGSLEAFWQAQRDRDPNLARPILERLLGYFSTQEPAEQIVHLYRYDDWDDWIARLHGLYKLNELQPYFKAVRALLTTQENKFLVPAPLAELTPRWGNGNDWFPGARRFSDIAVEPELFVEESTVTLLPGTQPLFWDAYREHGLAAGNVATENLLGCFVTVVGRQHQIMHYRCYSDDAARSNHHERLEQSDAWTAFTRVTADYILSSESRSLQPSQIGLLSPLFAPPD